MFCEKAPDLNISQFTVLQRPILTNFSHFAIAKKNNRKDMIEKFNAALLRIKESGEYQKIIDKYN